MKYFFSIIIVLMFCGSYAQERGQLRGKVTSENIPLENVHVKNITTRKYSLTDAEGVFSLASKAGDTLVLSHVGMEDLIKFVSQNDMASELMLLQMIPVSSELDEVLINGEDEINAVSLGIIPKKVERIPQQQRKLRAAGDFKPIHLLGLLGGSLPIDPMLNAITGRTKKLKKTVAVEHKLSNKKFLQDNYWEYIQQKFKLTEVETAHFVDYLIEETNVQAVIESKNEGQMHFFLQDQWFNYQDTVLNKNEED